MPAADLYLQYQGDGCVPDGSQPVSRKEQGRYVASRDLVIAVQTALMVEQPLLVTGEPGTGKTALAWSVASELVLGQPLVFYTRSDHQARDVLYSYDHLLRFYHAQTGDPRAQEPAKYVTYQALGEAIRCQQRRVVLIDEIDKAPRDFPNDLLHEIDQMEFTVHETGESFVSTARPLVIITSNSERQLPDAFLRRCVFHHIAFPSRVQLEQILSERLDLGPIHQALVDAAISTFEQLRNVDKSHQINLEKKPATSELSSWLKVLIKAGVDPERIARSPLGELPYSNVIIKTRNDRDALLERAREPR